MTFPQTIGPDSKCIARSFSLGCQTAMRKEFHYSQDDQPHPERTRAILKAHPEVRSLMGRNPATALIAVLILVI